MATPAAVKGAKPLFGAVAQYLPEKDLETVHRAYELAASAHGEQRRATGDPYISHPVAVATILADLHLDAATLTAALLHDVVEDTSVTLATIEREFGPEVGLIVDGVTKLKRLQWVPDEERASFQETEWAENLRKMLLAMAEDLRVVLVKLADRLHNMQTLQPLAPD